MDTDIIIDGVNVAECECFEPKAQVMQCHRCAITQRCKENNCHFKQLQRLKSEFSEVLDAKCDTIAALRTENEELKKEIMVLRNGYDEEDCTLTCPSLQTYRQSDEEGQEIIAELKAKIKELRDSLMEAEAIIITYQLKDENKNE